MIDLLKENFPDARIDWEKTSVPSDLYKIKSFPYGIYIEQFDLQVILMTIFKKHPSGHYENLGGASGTDPQEIIDHIKQTINPKIL